MASRFFALFSRMKYINRWALMRNTAHENLSQHSLEVAAFAHALAVLGNRRLGRNYNAERAALLGIYHDMPEIITGDMPTPIKYQNPEIIDAYKQIEDRAADRLISLLPEDFRDDYSTILKQNGKDDDKLHVFVKAADRYSALIKCIEEMRMGNDEFRMAKETIQRSIDGMKLPEAEVFEREFLPSFYLALDELN